MSGKGGDQRDRATAEGGSRPVRLRPPSDADWAAEIYRFAIFRAFEDSTVLARATALPAILEREAATLCGIADEVDRTLDTTANVFEFRASAVLARIEAKGYGADLLWLHVRNELIEHLLEPVKQSPSALRQRAYAIRDASDRAKETLGLYTRYVKRLRGARGPSPSVAMFVLFETADRWRSSTREIARRFVAADVLAESTSDEPDPVEQWAAILTKARKRARELRTTKATG